MKRNVLVCGGVVLMIALLDALCASAVTVLSAQGMSTHTLALYAMAAAAVVLAVFIHYSFRNEKRKNGKRGA